MSSSRSQARFALLPGRAMVPACCCAIACVRLVVGVAIFVRVGQARVVAVEAAIDVAGAAEPVAREALLERELPSASYCRFGFGVSKTGVSPDVFIVAAMPRPR